MDDILGMFFSILDDVATDPATAQIVFAVMLGLAVFTLVVAALLLLSGLMNPLRRRLQRLRPAPAPAATERSGLVRALEPVEQLATPRAAEARVHTQQRLRQAGITANGAVGTFYGIKLLLIAILPLVTAGVVLATTDLAGSTVVLFAATAAVVGYLAPNLWLNAAIERRAAEIRNGLPEALDLMVVCSEAGLGLSAAIQRVALDLEVSHPTLSEELRIFGLQTRAGMNNHDALRDLEERNGVEDLRGLVTTLLQSMRFGTSVAATLRIYSEELRDKRMQRAEEHAAKVGTKMLFPLVLCIFPAFFVVALGPPLLGAMRALSGG